MSSDSPLASGVPVPGGSPVPGAVDLGQTLRVIASGWRIILACVAAALVAAVLYLNLATYRYSVEMRVAPVASSGNDGLSSKLSSLGGLAAVAGVSLPDSGGSGSFKLFVEALHSRDVADVLARDPVIMHGVFAREWDARTGRWRMPQGVVHDLAGIVKPILGVPPRPATPPDAARLQQWMTEQVAVDQNLKTPVVTITVLSEDPAFGVVFLDRLAAAIDAMLRQRALLRTDEYIRYLSARLPTITLAEQRVAIAQALGEQERVKMVASANRPYSAEIFENPAASDRPVTPAPLKVLAVAVVLGLAAGIAFALRRRLQPRRMLASEL